MLVFACYAVGIFVPCAMYKLYGLDGAIFGSFIGLMMMALGDYNRMCNRIDRRLHY